MIVTLLKRLDSLRRRIAEAGRLVKRMFDSGAGAPEEENLKEVLALKHSFEANLEHHFLFRF